MDSLDLVRAMKKAAVEAVNASKPANVVFGKVVGVNPLKIQIDQKLILGETQLVVCEQLTDHTVSVDIEWETEDKGGGAGDASYEAHHHDIVGAKDMVIHGALVAGDKVVMVQMAGGQKYVVMDRIGGD